MLPHFPDPDVPYRNPFIPYGTPIQQVTPLGRVFDSESPEDRLVGVLTLVQIAAKVCDIVMAMGRGERVILPRGGRHMTRPPVFLVSRVV